jgi:methionine-R-sulfoxide reductase
MKDEDFKKNVPQSEEDIKKKLSPQQYSVMRKEGTEAPFTNEYCDHHEEGIYVDRLSGEPLFCSKDKYDSGSGWPSFKKPIDPRYLKFKKDHKLFEERVEVRSSIADNHLGHVFEDGPAPTGKRFCMNSASLRFISKEKLKEEGYEEYLCLFN